MHKIASVILGITAFLSLAVIVFRFGSPSTGASWTVFAVSVAGLGIIDVLQRIQKVLTDREFTMVVPPPRLHPSDSYVQAQMRRAGGYQPVGTTATPNPPPKKM